MVTLLQSEAEFFHDLRTINHGEFYDVEVPEEGDTVEMKLFPSEMAIFDLLSQGYRAFHTIGVHNGRPAFAVIEGISRYGNRFRRKIKLHPA